MKVLDKVNQAEEQMLSALSTSHDRVIGGIEAARGAVTSAADRAPSLPSVDLPTVELPGFGEVVDNVTDFWLAVLQRNRAFAHRLHEVVTASPAPAKRTAAKSTTKSKATKGS